MNDARIDPQGLLERLLDVASRRQALVASNVANVNTPGYSTRDLDFERAMEAAAASGSHGRLALAASDPRHLAPARADSPEARFEFEPGDLPRRNDFNNVSIDREMLVLGRTAGRYSAAIEILRKRFALLRYAISDGRSGS